MSYEGPNFFDVSQQVTHRVGMDTIMLETQAKPFQERWGTTQEFVAGEMNANYLRAVFNSFSRERPVRVYLPSGRYYIGLPATPEVSSEQEADLLVPDHVTLVFGPKATLVPLVYTKELIESRRLRDEDWLDARTRLPESELWRVRIEVQGLLEADLDKIFDPFCEDDRNREGLPSTDMPVRRGGTVFFTRDNLRAVYPEWWGAIPKRGDDGVLSDAEVRRTTVAIQSCIDAVLHHRLTLPRGGGQTLRPSTEVVFANDYVIDRPIRLGMTLARARTETGLPFTGDEYPFHQIGLSIRGLCGPATRRNGAALLLAAHNFEREEVFPEVTPRYGDSYSLMIVRTFGPVSIDNVIFDAAGVAERCLTVMTFTSTHHHVLEGCTFKNALYAQLYVGGEMPDEMGPIVPVRSRYFSGGQDLGDMRVSRCHFDTGAGPGKRLLRPPYRKDMPVAGQWLHGVVYRAEPALGTEFFGCVFTGPATPMFLAIGGRLSFQRCFFKTNLLVAGNPRPSRRTARRRSTSAGGTAPTSTSPRASASTSGTWVWGPRRILAMAACPFNPSTARCSRRAT